MKIHIVFLSLLLVVTDLHGQVFIETSSPVNPRDAFGSVIVYGSDGLAKSIPYSRIKGSPFWSDEWYSAILLDKKDSSFGRFSVKMNLATHEVHFRDKNGKEMVPGSDVVRKIIIYDNADSTGILTVFNKNISILKLLTKQKDCYVQELNQGDVKLMKITRREVKTADSLFGTEKRYYFADQQEYFLQIGERTERVRKLNKDELLSFFPRASAYEAWIKEKGLRFNKESDCVTFISHYNATNKKDE